MGLKNDQVWRKFKRNGNKRFRNQLIKQHLPLVWMVALKLVARLPNSVAVEDLVSDGVFGLMDAIDLFDLKRGVKFSTYCVNRIRGSMIDKLRTWDWTSRLARDRSRQLEKTYNKLETKYNRPPNEFEMAKKLRLDVNEYNELVRKASTTVMLSYNYKRTKITDEPGLGSLIRDPKAEQPFRDILNAELIKYLRNKVSKKERRILEMYFYDGLMMREIAVMLNIHESMVSQIYGKVIAGLRAQFNKHRHDWL